jgi:broad specificity phosphatase PhoE
MIVKLAILATVAGLGTQSFGADGEILVTLVRHADIALPAQSRDPDILPEGTERAKILGDLVKDSHVDVVFSTEYLRTRHTAQIAAERAGARAQVIGAARSGDLVADIREHYQGKSVLVVGHSNTVPALIEALGGPSLPNIDEREFDNVYYLKIVGDHAELTQAKYGIPSVR